MVTNNRKEKISAYLDNEIHDDEIVSFSLSSEQEDAEIIKRYQMVGDALRGQVSDASFVDVSQAVHNALQSEAPLAELVNTRPASAGQTPARIFSLSSWFRPAAGLAVAASVAMVMIVTLSDQQGSSPGTIANNVESQPQSVQQMAHQSTPVASPPVQLAIENGKNTNTMNIDPRLVKQHLEFATQDTYQGRLPYVRAVSYQRKSH